MSASSTSSTKDLEQTGVIHIERSEPHDPMFKRVLHLVKERTRRRAREPDDERNACRSTLGNQTS